ncbi:MAG TPA: DUF4240 domain-containing protein [Polyangiaceae bacterium]|jgi:hypothetical protein
MVAKKKRTTKAKTRATKKAKAPDLWELIEEAWTKTAPKLAKARAKPTEDNVDALDAAAEDVMETLKKALDKLDKAALLAVDRQLERALFRIDRQEIQEVTDGSDDGFLYARGFIVAMGKTFYDAVDAKPKRAVCDAECEEMCYLPWHLYREKFGEPPSSPISRESCSNEAGWED